MEEIIDLKKEKDAAKSMLKLVEEGLNDQRIKTERKMVNRGDRMVCPSSNWNSVRKKIGIFKSELYFIDKMNKEKQAPVKEEGEKIPKVSKKKNKRAKKQESKENAEKTEVKDVSLIDHVFNPKKYDKSKALTPIVSLDCEMVEVDDCSDGLARVSIVNYNGHILLDTFVRPKGKITNYRSWVSGVYPSSMKDAMAYDDARQKAIDILKDRVIVGHSLKHDFKVLNWEPLSHNVRDLITFNRFHDDLGKHPKSLKKLAREFLEKDIQSGAHSSVIDARAALGWFRVVEQQWNQLAKSKQSKIKRARVGAEKTVIKL